MKSAVTKVIGAVSQKSAISAIEGIMLKSFGDTLFLAGYDLEIGIDDQYKEPSYHFISQNPSQEDEKTDGVSSPSKK